MIDSEIDGGYTADTGASTRHSEDVDAVIRKQVIKVMLVHVVHTVHVRISASTCRIVCTSMQLCFSV